MRVIFSEKVEMLSDLIMPYVHGQELAEDAPDEVKEKFPEFLRLLDEEYERACI